MRPAQGFVRGVCFRGNSMTEERDDSLTNQSESNNQATIDAAEKYDPNSVQILQNAEHIRQRPGMYIGDSATKGLHHLVYELVYNSVDEALAGHCRNIQVTIEVDGSISVAD